MDLDSEAEEDEDEDESEVGGLFKLVRKSQMSKKERRHMKDREDSCDFAPAQTTLNEQSAHIDWDEEDVSKSGMLKPIIWICGIFLGQRIDQELFPQCSRDPRRG